MADGFPPGFAIEFRQQLYQPLRLRPYLNRLGQQTCLIDWLTHCPECGTEFTISTGLQFSGPRRRCDACKAPGHRVKRRAPHQREDAMREIVGPTAARLEAGKLELHVGEVRLEIWRNEAGEVEVYAFDDALDDHMESPLGQLRLAPRATGQ